MPNATYQLQNLETLRQSVIASRSLDAVELAAILLELLHLNPYQLALSNSSAGRVAKRQGDLRASGHIQHKDISKPDVQGLELPVNVMSCVCPEGIASALEPLGVDAALCDHLWAHYNIGLRTNWRNLVKLHALGLADNPSGLLRWACQKRVFLNPSPLRERPAKPAKTRPVRRGKYGSGFVPEPDSSEPLSDDERRATLERLAIFAPGVGAQVAARLEAKETPAGAASLEVPSGVLSKSV